MGREDRRDLRLHGGAAMTELQTAAVGALDGDVPAGLASLSLVQAPPRSTRVLVADLPGVYRDLLCRGVEQSGYQAVVAGSAEEAVEAFEREAFALALVGTDSSGLDGYETAQRMRQAQGTGVRTPILAVTGEMLPSERRRRKAAGFDNYLARPVRLDA